MRLDLVLQKSYVERALFNDCFLRSIEIELPEGFEQAHVIATRNYQTDNAMGTIGGDINGYVLKYSDTDYLVGRLLTHIDATFADQEQRKAQKDVVKSIVYEWGNKLQNDAAKIVDAQHRKLNGDARNDNS